MSDLPTPDEDLHHLVHGKLKMAQEDLKARPLRIILMKICDDLWDYPSYDEILNLIAAESAILLQRPDPTPDDYLMILLSHRLTHSLRSSDERQKQPRRARP